ncbi:hypothetical protein NGR_c11500 [Sinorhizobium fredii NGR234]|uniref:Transmembrane protein n=1 Tax=Sinorhizobium fredii (strain NBRC 101917 / NGR234) TaxID=394 RepID=C3MAU2_SINFN|nr:hypothetical protein [Sinorhizobium fredii]ACP24935.1 hypothetical protein NGR_c11500 [Sinorhizobium fredii NGR234]
MASSLNFYQRANLSMGLAVILGFELAISQWARNLDHITLATVWSRADTLLWIGFQFFFRVKVTIDDHDYFAAGEKGLRGLLDFLMFVVSSFLFVLSAVLSFLTQATAILFILGVLVLTVWVLFGAKEPMKKTWIFVNAAYIIVLSPMATSGFFGAIGQDALATVSVVSHAVLFALLFIDYHESKTHEHMPDY